MVVVVGRVVTDAERRDELVRIGQAVAAASREEPGCIAYRLHEDTERPNHFVFVEEWASQEALQQHFGMPHVAEFMSGMAGVMVEPPDVKFHQVASTMDLEQVTAAAQSS
ncbi:MAG TPA: putative quinol monooxygenase [Solirubrobacteraceae bacterium]|nr:putative quinol monooxygenase [Solirubrobacteraceae bacterium]